MGCPVVTKVRKPASVVNGSVEGDVREADRLLLLTILNELVSDPNSIRVEIMQGERTTVFNVSCEQICIGQIIGTRGKNISAIRNIIASIAGRKGYRAIIEIPHYKAE
ncbi:KH domain-containing protein [Bdellovibrio svalbardensis]|uniref:KH domain-containing protein n=1 Tax=Bdellovibrio svalbardensis TaxID=2972972 RepID=A0ABT6DGL1_9BACT|nr:KH domain-containing protein [Bdellovibrio svalbardensis]MDG0815953.1 KH domain-containing protein [Bdellovibrio svalbardensis]